MEADWVALHLSQQLCSLLGVEVGNGFEGERPGLMSCPYHSIFKLRFKSGMEDSEKQHREKWKMWN